MEFIGKNLPNIQTQYSSSLDSVRTGITETTKALGVQGLESAFENFLAENIGNPGALDAQSWIGNAAQFPDPLSFFAEHGDVLDQLDSPFVSEELFTLVKDNKFQPAAELENLVAILNQSFADNNILSDAQQIATKPSAEELDVNSFKMLSGDSEELKPEEYFQKMMEFVGKKQQEIEAKMEDVKRQAFNSLKKQVFEEFENRVESDKNQAAASKDSAGSAGNADQRGIIIVGGKPQDPAADQGIIVVGGKPQDPSADRGIIIVGGTPQDSAAQRGIIIVGGKTDGTHFQTIDDSLEYLQRDPKPENLQIFRQQLVAIQDMTSTAQKAVLLQKEFTANSFSGRIQG